MILYTIILIFIGFAGFALYVRAATDTVETWHVDPLEYIGERGPRSFGAQYILNIELQTLIDNWQQPVFDGEDIKILAGTLDAGHITYVARTKTMKYPDYISLRVAKIDDKTSQITVYSRSRFGKSDIGMNEKRIEAWILGLSGH